MVSLSRPNQDAPLITALASSPRPAVIHRLSPEQRIELSGTVVSTWAAKTVGLLQEYGTDGPAPVVLDLPLHWMSLALSLGARWSGAALTVVTDPEDPAADDAAAVLTDRPEAWAQAPGELFAVTAASGLEPPERFPGALPDHATDVAQEILGQPDRCTADPRPVVAPTPDDAGAGAEQASEHARGTLLLPVGRRARLTREHTEAALRAWRRLAPVVIDETAADAPTAVTAEGLA